MADVKWIKISTDIFENEKISLISSMQKSESIIIIWFKLLCLAGKQNNSGVFIMSNGRPYTDKMLATLFGYKESAVTRALDIFLEFGMIARDNGVVSIPGWEKHQSLDQMEKIREQGRARSAKHREKQKALAGNATGNVTDNVTVTQGNAQDKNRTDEDKNRIDEDKNGVDEEGKEESTQALNKLPCGAHRNVYLSDYELAQLKQEFPADYLDRIDRLSTYMQATGKNYADHMATIRNWAMTDAARKKKPEPPEKIRYGNFDPDDAFRKALLRSYGDPELVEEILRMEKLENAR